MIAALIVSLFTIALWIHKDRKYDRLMAQLKALQARHDYRYDRTKLLESQIYNINRILKRTDSPQ